MATRILKFLHSTDTIRARKLKMGIVKFENVLNLATTPKILNSLILARLSENDFKTDNKLNIILTWYFRLGVLVDEYITLDRLVWMRWQFWCEIAVCDICENTYEIHEHDSINASSS